MCNPFKAILLSLKKWKEKNTSYLVLAGYNKLMSWMWADFQKAFGKSIPLTKKLSAFLCRFFRHFIYLACISIFSLLCGNGKSIHSFFSDMCNEYLAYQKNEYSVMWVIHMQPFIEWSFCEEMFQMLGWVITAKKVYFSTKEIQEFDKFLTHFNLYITES